jgi:hypothetical protein
MDVASRIRSHDYLPTEAAVIEALGRTADIKRHPQLMNALLIYDPTGRRRRQGLYHGFADVAAAAGGSILWTTPTWRANRERLTAAGATRDVNADAVRFMQAIRAARAEPAGLIGIGGLLGCRNGKVQTSARPTTWRTGDDRWSR